MAILYAMGLMMTLLNMDFTIINIALPTIATQLHMTLFSMQWAVSALLVGSAGLLVLGGRLADIYGKRCLFFYGSSLFIIASLAAGLSINTTMLIISRFFQGIGIALTLPVLYAIPLTRLPKQQHGFAAGFMGMSIALGMLIGPTIGGLICHYTSWRWIFLINIPIGLIALALAKLAYPHEDHKRTDHFRDFTGGTIFFVAVTCLIVANTILQHWTYHGAIFYTLLALFIIFTIRFITHERNTHQPMVDLSLFRIRTFTVVTLIRTIHQLILVSVLLYPAILMKNWLGYSSIKTGLILLSMTISMGVFSIITGKVIDKFGARRLLSSAAIITAVGCAGFLLLTNNSPMSAIIIPLLLIGIAAGTVSSTCPKTVIQSVPADKAALVTGIFLSLVVLGAAIGVSLSGSLLALTSNHHLWSLLKPSIHSITDQHWHTLTLIANGARPLSSASEYHAQLSASFLFGFKAMVILWLGLSALMLVLTAWAPSKH